MEQSFGVRSTPCDFLATEFAESTEVFHRWFVGPGPACVGGTET